MRKMKQLCLMVLALFLLLPTTAWAVGVPEVTEDEYRYFLEEAFYYALVDKDLAQYSTEELKELLYKTLDMDEKTYREQLISELWYMYGYSRADIMDYTTEELECCMAEGKSRDVYWRRLAELYQEYQVDANLPQHDPREGQKQYYIVVLQKDYNVTEDLSDYEWYELKRMEQELRLQQKYGVTEDLSAYSQDDLDTLEYRKEREMSLKENYGVMEDLSAYTDEELETLESRKWEEGWIREEYGVTEDLSVYTDEELKALKDRLWEEQWLREEYGVTEDLSGYTLEELEAMRARLSLEADLRQYGAEGDLSQYTMEELEAMEEELSAAYYENWQPAPQPPRTDVQIQINGLPMKIEKADKGAGSFGIIPAIEKENSSDLYRKEYRSDVAPVMKEGRVYIPFRAVFEALDATVAYDSQTETVTAQRDKRTVSFTAGQSRYVMDGVTIDMDAQAFVQDGRTFVPVRFASQALGVSVGWDSTNRTVVIIDKVKLAEQYKNDFTALDKYLQHWDFGDSNVALQGTINLQMRMLEYQDDVKKISDVPVEMTAEVTQLSSDDKENMNVAVTLDLAALINQMRQEGSIDEEGLQMLRQLKEFELQYILDYSKGCVYVKSELMKLVDGDADTWYSIGLEDYLEDSEYQEYVQLFADAMDRADEMGMGEYLAQEIADLSVTDAEETAETMGTLRMMKKTVSDTALEKIAEGQYLMYLYEDGTEATLILKGEKEALNAADLSVHHHIYETCILFTLNEKNNIVNFTVRLDEDYDEEETLITCDGQLKYTATDEVPVSQPEQGSKVADLAELLESYYTSLYNYAEAA